MSIKSLQKDIKLLRKTLDVTQKCLREVCNAECYNTNSQAPWGWDWEGVLADAVRALDKTKLSP